MNALLVPAPIIVPQLEASPVEKVHPELVEKESNLKNIALFMAAPFIGLLYAVLLPFVGVAMLAWVGGQALVKVAVVRKALNFMKNVALFIAAPFVGLVYVILLPFVGAAMLAWVGVRALMSKPSAA